MYTNGSLTLKFKVNSFRHIPNPYARQENGNKSAEMYIAICDVKDIPDNIPMKTNPREQKMTTNVVKRIKASLRNESELNFYLLNRGLLLSAKSVTHDQYTNEVTMVFEDEELHGNVDGGHTYKSILENRKYLERNQQFVKIEILTGIEDIFQSLAAARNTSVQVQDKSIAELENRFSIIKKSLSDEIYMNRIFFKENDTSGDIDVADLLAMLNMFNIDRYVGQSSFPTNSYSSKKKCIDYYIQDHKKYGESSSNPYVKMSAIMPDIFRLYDEIETNMSRFYKVKYPSGRYGAVKGVQTKSSKKDSKDKDKDKDIDDEYYSKFLHRKLDAISPTGFTYPILGAFRALIEEKDQSYQWKKNPFSILEKVGPDLVDSTVLMSRSLGNNSNATGKDSNLWRTLYLTVAFETVS